MTLSQYPLLVLFYPSTLNVALLKSLFTHRFSSPLIPLTITSHKIHHTLENYPKFISPIRIFFFFSISHKSKSLFLMGNSNRYLKVPENKLLIYPLKLALPEGFFSPIVENGNLVRLFHKHLTFFSGSH